jgi:hypothetical protein
VDTAPPGAGRGWIRWLILALLGGYLLFCHGCHGDEDDELFAVRGISGVAFLPRSPSGFRRISGPCLAIEQGDKKTDQNASTG